MNLAQFGLKQRPFRPTPDTEAFYPSPVHELALHGLRSAYASRDALALIDGEPGTGKTLVALKFLESLPEDVARVLIPAPRFGRPADFFQAILFDLGAEYRGLNEQELRLSVTEQFLNHLSTGKPTVVVIDEAQHLTAEVLEEIRLLGNLETRSSKAVFFVLVAQPQLRERLTRPEYAALTQRIATRVRLEPLDREESARYVWHQLEIAGTDPNRVITEEALNFLTAHGKGIPRVLNQAASLAFGLSGSIGAKSVDVEALAEALTQLGLLLELPPDEPDLLPHPGRKPRETDVKPAKGRTPRRKSA